MENPMAMAVSNQNFLEVILTHGGIAAYLIIASALILFVVGGERLLTLFFKLSFNVKAQLENVRSRILEKKYTEALQVCNTKPEAPEIHVVRAGLMAVENGREAMKSALSGAVLQIGHKTETRLAYISLIANAATLLGLLGTISGLIKTFQAVATADASSKAQKLGMGISEAMYATAAGLTVGVVAMVIHTLCVSRADAIVGEARDAGLKLVTWIEQSERSDVRAETRA